MSSDGDRLRPEQIARVFIRPIGSVLPLGFLVFAVGALVTASFSLGWIQQAEGKQVFLLLLVFVVPAQATTCVLAFLARDTAGATTLGVFAATWGALAATGLTLGPGETSRAVGVFLLADACAILVLAGAAVVGNPAFAVLLTCAAARFGLNGAFEVTGSSSVEHVSGWVGLVLSAVAGYGALAFLLEDARQEPVLPMLRHGAARRALEAELLDQVRRLEREPGVRGRL